MNWQEMRLDELGSVSRGRSRHRPRDAAHLYGGPHPFVQTGDIKHASLYLTQYTQTYSDAGLEQSKLWPKGTLCITIAANIAETAILGIDACFPDSVIGFIADETKADARFIKYTLDIVKQHYQQVSRGAAQDNLSLEKLLSFKLQVPPVQGQRRIADILSAYDDLIENNLRRIALLEESARLLYREWFVRLRFPGHEHSRIVDGVPEGWNRMELQEIAEEIREQIIPGKVEADTPYIGLEHMPRRSITLSTWGKASEVQSAKHVFKERDILFGKIRPYFHKVGVCFTGGIASTDAIVIRPCDDDIYGLVLMTVSSDEFVAHANQSSYGAKMPRADWKVLKKYAVSMPPPGLRKQFSESIEHIVSLLKNLTFQNQKLKLARDLLLPRLMRGEIAV